MNTIRLKTSQSWILNASFKSWDSSMIVIPVIPPLATHRHYIASTTRCRTSTNQSPLRSTNANVQSFKLQIKQLKQDIVKLQIIGRETMCKSYRCNWESICASLSATDFYVKFKPFMDDYNAMMRIISQSKQELTNQECLTLKQLKLSLDSKWKEIRSAAITDKNMVPTAKVPLLSTYH
eukprot:849226_1